MVKNGLRIAVAMSGGVDSSVAAALLVDQGYEVIGVMLRLWSDPGLENLCCTPDSMDMARNVAIRFGFPFHVVDAKAAFREKVVQYFIDQYKTGNTPNPCIACNRHFRWHTLLEVAAYLDATHIASGHYARLETDPFGHYRLLRGVDPEKDQSYVLHGLSQDQLAHILFPLGGYTKTEIRNIAHRYQLPAADRPDSQDLCFVGSEGYRDFLVRHAPEVIHPGLIIDTEGNTLGTHQGLAFYTIGQRKGLGIAAQQPFYVLKKNILQNALVIGTDNELGRDELTAKKVNWIAGEPPTSPIRVQARIRYKSRDVWAKVSPLPGGRAQVRFDEQIKDITPGQAVVFYNGEVCLGGGIIE